MTDDELSTMEVELQVSLPHAYKRLMAAFPSPELQGGIEFSLIDDAALNIERTFEYRAGYEGAPPWPSDFVHIGDDDDACPYAICCSDGTIVKTDHGNMTKRPLARYASIDNFVRGIQDS